MKKLYIALLIGIGIYGYAYNDPSKISTVTDEGVHGEQTLSKAYRDRLSDIQVTGSGKVIRVLRDDKEGSRHQRFILRLPSGQTLLISHNIDLAPRIDALHKGDVVQFSGEYEWGPRGALCIGRITTQGVGTKEAG